MQSLDEPFLEIHHQKLLQLLHKYFLIGGTPEAINEYITSENFRHTQQVQLDLVRTFQDDFIKYGKTRQIKYLDLLILSIPLQLGTKFVLSHVIENIRSRDLLPALELLGKARIIHKIIHSKADGLPLQARLNPKRFKLILLDIGLTQNILGVNLENWITGGTVKHVRGRAIAEAFVGQELAAYTNTTIQNPMVYWQREARGSSAELDFLLERAGKILPIEVKEGPSGRMKSLHLFMKEKGVKPGIKLSSFGFSYDKNIQSIPLYAVERLFV